MEYSFSSENTPGFGSVPPAVRVAPANFPDALSNEPTKALGANTTQPIWVTLYVPKTANPGMYSSASFTVTVPAAGTYTVDIRAASGWAVRLRLNAGANALTFAKGAGAGSNTAELDFIEVRP